MTLTNKRIKSDPEAMFDVSLITAAQRELAAETDLNSLATGFLRIVMQHSAADSGYLQIAPEHEFYAVGQTNAPPKIESTAEKSFDGYAHSIVDKVRQSGQTLWFAELSAYETEFGHDQHLVNNRPDSLVCFPLKDSTDVVGICYLENRRGKGRFSDQLLTLLEILATQLVIQLQAIPAPPQSNLDDARYHLIFENLPVASWEEDFSEVKNQFEQLRKEGIQDLSDYLSQHPEAIKKFAKSVRVVDINKAALGLYEASSKQVLLGRLDKTFTSESLETFRQELIRLWKGDDRISVDSIINTLAGGQHHVSIDLVVCPGYEHTLEKVFVSFVETGERKLIEETLLFITQQGWSFEARDFFLGLVKFLGEKLGFDYVMIDRLLDDAKTAETIACYSKGKITPNISYPIKGTPCENVVGKELCMYADSVQQRFPDDAALVEMEVESYVGIPLWDSLGQPIGLIALMDSQPVPSDSPAIQVLQMVASRASAELERQHSDRILKKREQDFRTLADNLPNQVVRYDTQGRAVYVNHSLDKLMGGFRQERIGKRVREYYGDGSFEEYAQAMDEVLETGKERQFEFPVVNVDGDSRLHWIHMVPERNEEGELTGILVIGRDITEQKRAEQELIKSEAQYRRIFETTQEGIWGQDKEFNTIFVNEHMANMLGYTVDEMLNRPVEDFVFAEDLAEVEQRKSSRRNRISETYERRCIRKDGTTLWTNFSATPIFENDEFHGVFAMVTDITARKEAELQLKQSLAFTEGVINAIPDILFEVDERGTYLNVWTRRPELLALPKEQLLGSTVRDVLTEPAADVCMQAIEEADRDGLSFGNILRLDLPDGCFWFELSLSKKPADDPETEPRFLVLSRNVTERMQIEQELRASEQRLQAILDQTFQFIGLLSTDGIVLQANRAALRFANIKESDVIGKAFWDTPWWTHSVELQEQLKSAIQQAAKGEFLRFEVTHPTPGGELRNVDFSISPVYNDSGEVVQLIPEGRDITEFKLAEKERQQHADRLAYMDRINRAIQSADDLETMMGKVLDEVIDIFDCDRAYLMYPCDPDAASWGIPMERTRADYPGLGAMVEGIPMDSHISKFTRMMLETPGAVRSGEGTAHPLNHEIDERLGIKSMISLALYPRVGKPWQFGLHQCSHERIWSDAEERLLEEIGRRLSDGLTALLVQRDLRRSERRLLEAQHLAHVGNWELDLIEDKLTWSDEIFSIFEIDKKKFGASYEAFVETIHPDDRDMVTNAYQESLVTRQPYDIVHRLLLANDRIKYVREMCETIYDDAGKAIRSLGTVQDITEQKLREDELNRYRDHLQDEVRERTAQLRIAKEKAEAASLAKSTFLASMSHELRTPLNAILGYADLLKQRTGDTESLLDGLDIMHSSGEHLLMLINDILDIAKIEAGKLELSPGPFHLPSFLQQIVTIVLGKAEAKHLTLSYESLSTLPAVVVADATLLRQVLLNLLGNAVKFTEKGSVMLTVEVLDPIYTRKDFVKLRFSVEDTGIGIAADQLEQIFEPFEQSYKPGIQVDGTGLGLAISHKIIQQMDGELQVTSEQGRGSRFWFDVSFPVSEMMIDQSPLQVTDITGYEGVLRKVLIADDKPYNRLLLRDLLQPIGFEVRVVGDGQQAIDCALSWHPDVILMDLIMPIKSGFQAIQEIRQQDGLENVFIIAISASVSEAMQEKSLTIGSDVFLPKPVELERLLDLIATHLNLKWISAKSETRQGAPIIAPPQQDLRQLVTMIEEGKVFDIQSYATQLESENPDYRAFARQLKKLARGFDMAAIEAFISEFEK